VDALIRIQIGFLADGLVRISQIAWQPEIPKVEFGILVHVVRLGHIEQGAKYERMVASYCPLPYLSKGRAGWTEAGADCI